MKRILVVDGDTGVRARIAKHARMEGYDVTEAGDGETALSLSRQQNAFDLMVLAVNLPGMDGFTVLKAVRTFSAIPVLILSSKNTAEDRIHGLELGADDYITKPFAIEELLARIRAALRKRGSGERPEEPLLSAGPLTMDVERHTVAVSGTPVELTRREFDLLHHLLENKGRVLSREALLDSVWGFDFVGETNSVDVYIRFLRSKIDEAFDIKLIHTVRGVGYVIREE